MAFKSDAIFWVEVHKIVPNPYQPRREFDEARLKELADSIRQYGVLQPLVVTRKETHKDDGGIAVEYELIAGERRLRASRLAGLEQVPVLIRDGAESDRMKLELAIIENLQREDLNAVDRARAFKQLADEFELSHAQIGQKVGRSREFVSNTLRILLLPDDILQEVARGALTEGHGRTLLMLNDRPEEQKVLMREILMKKLSVREVERITRKMAMHKVRKTDWGGVDPVLFDVEQQLSAAFGTRVQIMPTTYGGRVAIDYFSQDDLRKILEAMMEQKGLAGGVPPVSETQATTVENAGATSEISHAVEAEASEPTEETTPVDDRATEEKKEEEDTDLYSIRNFSL